MGLEAKCVASVGGLESEGVAKLETEAVYFKGEMRLKIPLAGIQSVEARDGWLWIASASAGEVSFQLGPAAEKWASKILHPKSRIDKLGVKHGMEVMLLGLDDPGFLSELKPIASRVVQDARSKDMDVIFWRVDRAADLEKLAGLRLRIKPAGAIWILALIPVTARAKFTA